MLTVKLERSASVLTTCLSGASTLTSVPASSVNVVGDESVQVPVIVLGACIVFASIVVAVNVVIPTAPVATLYVNEEAVLPACCPV